MSELSTPWLKQCLMIVALAAGTGGGLVGCSTSADVSYGSYSFSPGYEAGHVYENRVYADTQHGVGGENCLTLLKRRADASGRLSSYEETVCE